MNSTAVTLSVVMPAFNEARFVGQLIQRIESVLGSMEDVAFEIIVVDDASTDGTADIVTALSSGAVQLVRLAENRGKGAAVQEGIRVATGDYVLVQDADLEYFPEDIPALLAAVDDSHRVAVYGARLLLPSGTRIRGWIPRHPQQSPGAALANRVLSIWLAALFAHWIDDLLTGYKLYPREVFAQFTARTSGFETDHEITTWLLRNDYRIVEVPVRYRPRSKAEGKKIRARDGAIALRTIARGRFASRTGST